MSYLGMAHYGGGGVTIVQAAESLVGEITPLIGEISIGDIESESDFQGIESDANHGGIEVQGGVSGIEGELNEC